MPRLQRIDLRAAQRSELVYHNAEELRVDRRGITPLRVASQWVARMPARVAERAQHAAGIELRFRADTRYVALDLWVDNRFGYRPAIALYHGNRNVALATLPFESGRSRLVLLNWQQPIPRVKEQPWRILMPYGAAVTLGSLTLTQGAELLPVAPRPKRWLLYGDSIAQGAHAFHPGCTFASMVGDALGWDTLNLGFGGCAWGDEIMAHYLASRIDWDVLTIAIGTNSYGSETESAQDFARTYDRFLDIIREVHPSKPILCVTPIWRHADGPPGNPNRFGDLPKDYGDAIGRVVARRIQGDTGLGLLDGWDMIGDDRGLTSDLIHPDAHGMALIADCVTAELRRLAQPRPKEIEGDST